MIRFRRMVFKEGRWEAPSPRDVGGVLIDRWELARNERELYEKLDGDMAEVIMPSKPLWVRLWRKLFPLKMQEMSTIGDNNP